MPSYAVESRRTPSYAADGARRYVTVPGVGGDLLINVYFLEKR